MQFNALDKWMEDFVDSLPEDVRLAAVEKTRRLVEAFRDDLEREEKERKLH